MVATSYMYIRNNSGPNTEPCGTPALMYKVDENLFLYNTFLNNV